MAYKFNGSEGKPIDLATAKEWAKNYRESMKNPDDTVAHFFGFEIIEKILAEDGCMGIRIYYGLNEKGEKQLMLVGANEVGDNLLPAEGKGLMDGGNTIADVSYPCPSYCPPNNSL